MTVQNTRDPHYWTATEALAALATRKISSLELLDHQLARQKELNPAINAIVEVNADMARATAQESDNQRTSGATLPPLAGLPMTIKDTLEVIGFGTTAGIPELANYRPQQDAEAVGLLRNAGAVFFGKTNIPVGASDHQSYNPVYGLTLNPWNLARTVGGSSGGSSAALAAGFTALELGSDIGGSIRIPSHYCGVYGHKPSYGIVPGRGHVPPAPGERSTAPLTVVGPLARSAQDLELAMQILAKPVGDTATGWSFALPPARHEQLKDFRIGVWLDSHPVDETYANAILEFTNDLRSEGARVTLVPGGPVDASDANEIYFKMLFGIIGAGSPDEERAAYLAAGKDGEAGSYGVMLAETTHQSFRDFVGLTSRQAHLQDRWANWFNDFDVLLCPVSLNVAFEHQIEDGHGPVPQISRSLTINDRKVPYLDNLRWPGVATVANLPSTVRPLNTLVSNMPAGVQIVGPFLEDITPIRFAALCDQAFGGFTPPPAYS